ncbi:hypothetical protein [Streptomyces sp. NPDC027717]|uniref:hypothetical protein n=1 Tax=Streptomyces sp. NPDC027717 TaxID=3155765 RepID=UPI0034097B28
MHPDNALVTFAQEGSRVFAWISASSIPPAASEQHHRYGYLTAALRQRGLECTVEWGLSDYIVHAELPDGSSLVISPPQEPPSEHPETPESWMVTRHRSAEPAVYEVVYDSEPDGPDARHGGSVPDLLDAVEARLDRLGIPCQEHERSAEERAAGTVLYRAGFVPAVAPGGVHSYRLPLSITDPAEQRLVVTRAFDMLQAEDWLFLAAVGHALVTCPTVALMGQVGIREVPGFSLTRQGDPWPASATKVARPLLSGRHALWDGPDAVRRGDGDLTPAHCRTTGRCT